MNNPPEWTKWGLSICDAIQLGSTDSEFRNAVRAHWLVSTYLDTHPEVAGRYRTDQSGELKYFDILDLAEQDQPHNQSFKTDREDTAADRSDGRLL